MASFDAGILSVSKPENCGCQELLKKISLTHYGWLRRKCLRNSFQIKYIKWPQQYVVIGNKCLYYYNSETSKHPDGSVSLYGFNRIVRASDIKLSEAIWAFKVEHVQPDIRTLYFAASSEREMLTWMKAIKAEMLNANHMKSRYEKQLSTTSEDSSTTSWDSGDYKDLEESIYMEPVGSRVSQIGDERDFLPESEQDEHQDEHPPLPPRPSKYNPGKRNSSFTYSLQQELANTLNRSASNPVFTEPTLSSKAMTSPNSDNYWESVYFNGSKLEAAEIISRLSDDGVYLIRKSDDGSNVLLFNANHQLRKFRIRGKENKQVSLSISGPDFGSLEELLYYYYTNNLPGTDIRLTTPYKQHLGY